MAPLTRQRKKARAAAAAAVPAIGVDDRLSTLPGDVLRKILGFLPAQEAVRTCVLARIWRDVWKATDRLVFTGESVQEVVGFVDRLLLLRLGRIAEARLSACELHFRWFEKTDEPRVNRWIRRALQCGVEALRVDMSANDWDDYLVSSDKPLASRHLKRLRLAGVRCVGSFLDLTSCPALEELEIHDCDLRARKMNSPSLRRLSIRSCVSYRKSRMRICAPQLVSLRLIYPAYLSRTPVLGSMPELVAAHVAIGSDHDKCYCDDPMCCHHVMAVGSCSRWENTEGAEQFYGGDDSEDTRECVLLSGLSEATDLTLVSNVLTYIFRRDLRWCPTFSNLKTLLINHYWCYPADCSALACILEHAPVLEKLTVLCSVEVGSNYYVEMKGRLDPKERSVALSKHLQIVEVKCDLVNEIVLNLLKFMSALNIWFQF